MYKKEEYERYLRKCEMLGTKMFEFEVLGQGREINIINYIPNDESERIVKIPDFVDSVQQGTFDSVKQKLIIKSTGLKDIMFDDYGGKHIDLSELDTSSMEDIGWMFDRCRELIKLDLSNFDTRQVTGMRGTFKDCIRLEELELSRFDTGKVRDMTRMFYSCSKLKELDLSNFNTTELKSAESMFNRCTSLEKLDIRNFDACDEYNIDSMFFECDNLKLIIVNKENKEWLEKTRDLVGIPKGCRIEEV